MFRHIKDRWLARLFTRYPTLVKKWARGADIATFSDTPWTPFRKKVSASRLSLITTGGVHLKSQAPFDMLNPSGDASYREIPSDVASEQLAISHNYYDHSDADRDINIIFPFERLQVLEQLGKVGQVNHRHFSLMGHITGSMIDVLISETVPTIADYLKSDAVDAVLLTPA